MAMVAAAVANGGTLVKPHLTDRIVDPDGRVSDDIGTSTYHRVMSGDGHEAHADDGQRRKGGNGNRGRLSGIEVAGKTGTAEVENGATNQVWFIGFAPATIRRSRSP